MTKAALKRSRELTKKQMNATPEIQTLFEAAETKEWKQFLEFGAVKVLSEEASLKYAG